MTQQRLRLASLTVVGGPLDGHRCALDDVVSELLIGSDPGCNLVIDLPTVSPIHAKIWADLDASMVRDTHAPRGVYVNATRVEAETQLKPRDLLWLGSPGDPQSVCVLPEFEAWVERIPEAVLPKEGAAPAAAAAGTVASDAFEPQSYAPAFEPQALEASAFEAPTDETRALPRTAQASGPGSEPQVFELEQAIQDGDASDPFFVSDAPPSTEAGSVPASVDAQAVVDESGAPVRIDLSSERAAEAPADALAETAGVGFDDDSFALQTEATASASEAIISEELEAVFAAPAEPKSAAPAPVAAAVPDEDLWAISAEPEAAQPASPAPAEAEDEFLLAEPGAEPETPEPTLLVSAAEPPAASWPAAQAPPPAPAPSARQVPLPPVAPSSSPAPLAAPRSAADHPAAARPAAAQPAAARPAAPPATPHRAPAPLAAHAPSAAAAHAGPGAHGAASMPVDVPDSELAPPPRPAAAAGGRKPVARGGAQRRRGMPGWMLGAIASAAVLLLAGAGVVGWQLFGGRVQVDAISPLPVRAGQRATLRGSGFSTTASENVVTFEGLPARVVAATGISLEVEVPPGAIETGTQRRMNVVVRKGSKQSQPIPVDVLQAPRLHGISPLAALPGEPVLLAGAGWGPGARVRFGNVEAQTVEIAADGIHAIVPPMDLPQGSPAPVVVSVSGVDSNVAPFVIGHLPLISGITPAEAAPGDVVQVNGVGFDLDARGNNLLIGGTAALVVTAAADSLKVVVPRVPAGDPQRSVELRVAGSSYVGTAALTVSGWSDPAELKFVAEPFLAVPGRPHAVLATRLGPAFVLAASGSRTAAERALEAQGRLNAAVPVLRADPGLTFQARGYEGVPTIGLTGKPDPLIEVSEQDAAAYNEDWTGLKGRGGPVSSARLARWWEAVGRDILLLTVRNERPRFTAALAAEGRVLGQLFDAAHRAGNAGGLWPLVEGPKAPQRDAFRLIALRVPATVLAPAGAAPAPTPPPPPQLKLEGSYRGRETEDNQIRYVIVGFGRGGGNVTYEGGITFSVPLLSLEQPARDEVRYSLRMRGGLRYYFGRWDGETIRGNITTDPEGRDLVGTFELRK